MDADPTYLIQKHCEGDAECEAFVANQLPKVFNDTIDGLPLEQFVIEYVKIFKKKECK